MKRSKFRIKKSKNDEWYFQFIAANGKEIARSSETYSSKQACKDAIDLMKKEANAAPVEDGSLIDALLEAMKNKKRL